MKSMSSGMNVFFIHIARSLDPSNKNSMPAVAAMLRLNIRP